METNRTPCDHVPSGRPFWPLLPHWSHWSCVSCAAFVLSRLWRKISRAVTKFQPSVLGLIKEGPGTSLAAMVRVALGRVLRAFYLCTGTYLAIAETTVGTIISRQRPYNKELWAHSLHFKPHFRGSIPTKLSFSRPKSSLVRLIEG